MYIPNLFGAYQAGREYAIDRNWKDLENYEKIEQARTKNDLDNLKLLQNRALFPLVVSDALVKSNAGVRNDYRDDARFGGDIAAADMYSTGEAVKRQILNGNINPYVNTANSVFTNNLNNQLFATQIDDARRNSSNPYDIGAALGNTAENAARTQALVSQGQLNQAGTAPIVGNLNAQSQVNAQKLNLNNQAQQLGQPLVDLATNFFSNMSNAKQAVKNLVGGDDAKANAVIAQLAKNGVFGDQFKDIDLFGAANDAVVSSAKTGS